MASTKDDRSPSTKSVKAQNAAAAKKLAAAGKSGIQVKGSTPKNTGGKYTNALGGTTKIADPWDVSGLTASKKIIPGTEWMLGIGTPGWGQEGFVAPRSSGITPGNANISNPRNNITNRRTGDAGLSTALKNQAAERAASLRTTGGGAAPRATGGKLTDLLRVPESMLMDIYNPVLEQLQQQEKAVNDRYKSNAENLKNIFGALAGLRDTDVAKINKQYADMIAASQTAYTERAAAGQKAMEAGTAQAIATGAERGLGPEMAVSPITTATAESDARAKEYETTWQNLQRANQAQAVADVDARTEGYNYQKVAAIQDLTRSLEDRLMQLGGNTAQVQSDIAAAKYEQEQNVAQANYAQAVAAQQAAARAASAQAAAAAKAAANVPEVDKIRTSLGTSAFNTLVDELNDAYGRAYAGSNPVGSTRTAYPKPADVVAEWINKGGNRDLLNQARTIADKAYYR